MYILYIGERLLRLFVNNERGEKVLICDEGQFIVNVLLTPAAMSCL